MLLEKKMEGTILVMSGYGKANENYDSTLGLYRDSGKIETISDDASLL